MHSMKTSNKKTSIALSEDTKEQLAQFENQKGESYDEILKRVMADASVLCNKKSQDNVDDGADGTEEEI